MLRLMSLFSSVALLVACGTDVRSTRLADVDLTNMDTLQEVRGRLRADEGAALATYALMHHTGSASFCGDALVDRDGKSPVTIGEAIVLTFAREREQRLALEESKRPRSPRELALQSWDNLTDQRDLLIDRQSQLRVENGASVEQLEEWKSLALRMSQIDNELISLKPAALGPGA